MIARLGLIAGLMLVAGTAVAQEEKLLNIYNWSDYIAEDTVPNFVKETGIMVNYDVYDSNEVLEAKLLAGHSGYDLVVPSAAPYLARQAASGVYRKIDKTTLKNYGNLDPQILSAAANADPGNQFGIPYMWGTTGFGFNKAKVKAALGDDAPTESSALLFDPANAKKLAACGISVLDSAQELIPAALAYLGRDPLSREPAELDRAVGVIQAIRPYIRKFHSSEYINDLANGDLCIAWGYSGDIVQARNRAHEAKNGIDIAYTIPKEGAMIWVDMMAIPADAPHPENALRFIDYILRPDVVAKISDTIAYANPNEAAATLVSSNLSSDPNVYPPQEVRARLFFDKPVTPQYERLRTRAWTRIKTGH